MATPVSVFGAKGDLTTSKQACNCRLLLRPRPTLLDLIGRRRNGRKIVDELSRFVKRSLPYCNQLSYWRPIPVVMTQMTCVDVACLQY